MFLPLILVEIYFDYAQEQGLDLSEFSSKNQIDKNYMHLIQYLDLLGLIKKQLPEHDIGAEIGWRFSPQLFDPLSTAIVSADNLQIALDTAIKFWDIFGFGLKIQIYQSEELTELQIDTVFQLNKYDQNIILKSVVICFYKMFVQLLPFEQSDVVLFFMNKRYPHAQINNIHIEYEATAWKIAIPTYYLNKKSFCANKLSFDRAIVQCERLLKLNGEEHLSKYSVGQSLSEIAYQKSISTKTIYRQLKQQGQSFRELKQNKKYIQAITLLKEKNLSIEQVAIALGYKDPSNFTRAFKKWTNLTPSDYRKEKYS